MIIATGLQFPKGPAFGTDGRLYCCNVNGGNVVRIEGDGMGHRVAECPRPNGLAIHPQNGALWIADSGARAILRVPLTVEGFGAPVAVTRVELLGPNDLVFAPDGTLYFTDPLGSTLDNPIGCVYRRAKNGQVEELAGGLAFPNGLALVGESLIVAETLRNRLIRIDLASNAVTEFCAVGQGPDGIALGSDGRLYVALYREACVAVVTPNGRVERKLPVQDEHPTNCCVSDSSLFVTLAATGRIEKIALEG
ncbi:MAG TPA: SMP-30/gluconolactonase/LRE family protein [Symbiobacteriaceae bacterium]|jgi:gluconolactonase